MPPLPADHLSLAIILRLHAGRCSADVLSRELGEPVRDVQARLAQLQAAGVVACPPSRDPALPRVYTLAPDAYRAVIAPEPAPAARPRPASGSRSSGSPSRPDGGMIRGGTRPEGASWRGASASSNHQSS